MHGFLIIDKPFGLTSFDVVRQVRKVTDTRRVGHSGTLDPHATGVLGVAVGKCTKLIPFIQGDLKVYEFDVILGVATESSDGEGEVIDERACDHISLDSLRDAAAKFVGEISQVPPAFSAVKVDGKRAYELARAGEAVELEPRDVVVEELQVLALEEGIASCRLRCGGGTYVRSLARDLGIEAGSCAHARRIRRVRNGAFGLEAAVAIDDLDADNVVDAILSPSEMVASLPRHVATPKEVTAISYGQFIEVPLDGPADEGDAVSVVDPDGRLVSVSLIRERRGERVLLHPKRVMV